jgi:hypothetical protein
MSTLSSQSNSAAKVAMADGAALAPHEILYAQVMLQDEDRTLLGNVVDLYDDGDELRARVKHFNGEDWPLRPNVGTLTILGSVLPAKPVEAPPHSFYCPVRCWCDKAER